MKTKVEASSALSTWLVSYAAEFLNKFKVQENGRTAYEMMTQHKCKHAVVAFGETVHFQHTKTGKDQYREDMGIFVVRLLFYGRLALWDRLPI